MLMILMSGMYSNTIRFNEKNNREEGSALGDKIIPQNQVEYQEIISIIERARENAYRAVNREIISMYWDIGQYISEKV